MKRYWFITFKETRSSRSGPSIMEVNDVIDYSPMEYWEKWGKRRIDQYNDQVLISGVITFAMEITEAEYLKHKDTIGNQ